MSWLSKGLSGAGNLVSMGTLGIPDLAGQLPTVPELTGEEAAKEANKKIQNAADASTALQREMWQTSRSDFAPYREAGTNALAQMTGYQMPDTGIEQFQASPDYNFRLQQGTNALLNAANAGGMRLSGRTLQALQDLGQQQASQEYGNWYGRTMGQNQDQWNRLAQMAGLGGSATSQAATANQQMANAISNNLLNQGQANAAATMQGYQGMNNLLNQGLMLGGMLL